MRILILGKGNVGRTLAQFHPKSDHLYYHDPLLGEFAIKTKEYEVGHITYPMVDVLAWVETTQQYMKSYSKVKWWMIHSTVVPEAFDYLPQNIPIVYSPIRATEGIMETQVARTRKYYAFITFEWDLKPDHPDHKNKEVFDYQIHDYIKSHFHDPLFFSDARALALGKLFATTDFGIQIALAQMMRRICEEHGYRFNEAYNIFRADEEYGFDYRKIGKEQGPMKWVPRAIFRPDVIGGRCVMQNAKLMEDAKLGDDKVLSWLRESNELEKRRKLNEK